MIVDTADPEVSEALARWFRRRDELVEIGEKKDGPDADLGDLDETEWDVLEALKDISDELVAFLAPTARDREHHLSLNPEREELGV